MRLVVNNAANKRPAATGRSQGEKLDSQPKSPITGGGDVVSLVSTENRRAVTTDVPTALVAEAALRDLQRDLPRVKGEQLGEIHSGLDRRVILSLLAPLMDA
ncbi:hypothetical protein AAU61_10155 [Desulfocarbo indianensis]|nr:hypothetical protein AAU61_10155 [Desulfocarbo indianensis]